MRVIVVLALVLSSLRAQSFPDGEYLNKQVAAQVFRSLQFVTETTIETTRGDSPIKIINQTSSALVSPGKKRTESKTQGMTLLVVSNGEYTWMYNAMTKEYTKVSAALGSEGLMASMGMQMPDAAKIHTRSQTVREETLEVDGQKHDCWVVESRIGQLALPIPQNAKVEAKMSDAVMTAWIEKKLLIDLQSTLTMKVQIAGMPLVEMRQKMVKSNLKINEAVPDSLFTFVPPPDANEVKDIGLFRGMLSKTDLAGKEAPKFEVQGLDGKSYSLTALKGKPVLLDFWATWCIPCRESMPFLESIYQQYKNQGLVILGVNTGEERELVEVFLKKTPLGYPAVLSGESEILEAYQVTAYPTFILIGSDGKIAAHEVGFGGEAMLRRMIEKVGLMEQGSTSK